MEWKTILGTFAATCTTIAFIPQAFKTIKTKDTASISVGMYSIFVFGTITWTIYGIVTKDFPIIIANIITSILAMIILFYKLKHK